MSYLSIKPPNYFNQNIRLLNKQYTSLNQSIHWLVTNSWSLELHKVHVLACYITCLFCHIYYKVCRNTSFDLPSYPSGIFTWCYIDISALLFFSPYSNLVMIYSTISSVSSSIIFNGWSTLYVWSTIYCWQSSASYFPNCCLKTPYSSLQCYVRPVQIVVWRKWKSLTWLQKLSLNPTKLIWAIQTGLLLSKLPR